MSPWTEERVSTVVKLWSDGLSATQIAKQLGDGISRCAVLGKVDRLRRSGAAIMPARGPIDHKTHTSRRRSMALVSKTALALKIRAESVEHQAVECALPVVLPLVVAPVSLLVTSSLVALLDLQPGMCRFPIGDSKQPGFGFCGAETPDASSWCPEHRKIVFRYEDGK